jgi:hypothetical protein
MTESKHTPPGAAAAAFPGDDWTAVGPVGPDAAHVRFTGHLEGRPVEWDAEILTLAECCHRLRAAGRIPDGPVELRQFIDVGENTEGGCRLTVALKLGAVDAPAVRKTVVMIRNYKRLRRGRHEYGERVFFAARHQA